MKNNRMIKLLALLLVLVLAGCSGGGRRGGELALQDWPENSEAMQQLVNDLPPDIVQTLEYAPELPAIDDSGSMFRSVKQVAIRFYEEAPKTEVDEIKAVWISYLEMNDLLTGKTESQFRANIDTVFGNAKNFGLNTVIVQVRPFGDALYKSENFPWSYICTGTEGQNPGYDPLEIMVSEAKSQGLRFEAWINPYRIRAAANTKALSASNQAQKWLDAGDSAVIKYNGIISYNPASEKARNHIISGVREIIRGYDIDGIHIDDYFYPTTDSAFDSASYNAYKNSGGTLNLADWRRSNVEKLVKGIYEAVKEEDSKVLFGISPQGNISENYNSQYLDVEKILATSGYCDYICPQVYWGFDHATQPFGEVVKKWDNMIKTSDIKLYIGIAAYKLGGQDSWAGPGKTEWLNTNRLLCDMVEASRSLSNYNGFVLYRYDSLFRPDSSVSTQVNREAGNLKNIL